jgi:hypothetical protein
MLGVHLIAPLATVGRIFMPELPAGHGGTRSGSICAEPAVRFGLEKPEGFQSVPNKKKKKKNKEIKKKKRKKIKRKKKKEIEKKKKKRKKKKKKK